MRRQKSEKNEEMPAKIKKGVDFTGHKNIITS
jgi:hypothetical protein